MAALGGQVLGGARTWARTWPRTWARTWAGLAAQPRGGQRRAAASRGGGRGARGPGARGEVAGALLAMGFSDAHVRGLLSVWRGARPRRVLDVVSELILLGLSPEHVCLALRSSPRLLDLPAAHAQRRSGYLRRLGLGEGKLKTLLLCCPEVFTMHQRDIENIVGVLKDKCLFTGQQVTRILHRCPYVLREDPGDLEYKFQVFPGARRQRGEERPFLASMSVWPCHPVKRDRCPSRAREGKAPGLRSWGAGAPTTYSASHRVTWREWVQAPRDPDP
ncbi:transcription termination factor 4, mitochondrial isoform X2 [Canis aureus]